MLQVQENIVFVFNRILINFFKEIKKDSYFKIAIKKNYKVIDKKNHKYVKYYSKKMFDNIQFLCDPELNVSLLEGNENFTSVNIFKNINIGRLFKSYKDDKNVILSYILTLSLLTVLYEDSRMIYEKKIYEMKNKEAILDDDEGESDDVNAETVLDDDSEDDDEDLTKVDITDENGDENGDDDDDDDDDDEDSDSEDEISDEDALNEILTKSLKILSSLDNNIDIDNELNEIMDDDVRIILTHIKDLKVDVTNKESLDNGNLDNLLGNSKIGKLAKEISDNIDLESLNINTDNPEEMLNPANLFSGENGNLIGNLVQQVGSSITEKMSSGELNQEDLVKDAFSLMNKMQNTGTDNPIIDNMVKNMMNTHQQGQSQNNGSESSGGMPGGMDMGGMDMGGMDMGAMMQQMMANMGGGLDQNMMQQMMNNMGGTQAMNQNNPNSREGKAKERLRNKLAEKKKNSENN